jgi:hypothetical protein
MLQVGRKWLGSKQYCFFFATWYDRSQRAVIIEAIGLVDLCGQYLFWARASIHWGICVCVCVCGPFDSPHVVQGMVWFTFSFPHMRGGSQHILWKETFLNAAVCTFFLSNVYFGADGGIEGLASSNFHPILWKLFIYYVLQTLYENSLTGFIYVPKKGRSVYSMRSKPCT